MTHGIVTPGESFSARATSAVANPELQRALRNLDTRLHTARAVADTTPEMKDAAAAIRREVLADLDPWLDRLEVALTRVGAVVHRAATPEEARAIVLDLVRAEQARTVVKSKSMATEEIDLGAALEAIGVEVVETDLGEYIVQVAEERPSHMITPAIHKTLDQIATVLGTRADGPLPVEREALAAWTHDHLRPAFLRAEVGISGVNFAAADTGTITIVTNEGNGRLCTTWPRVHVALMPVEKVIPRLADLGTLVPLLTRSATGQSLSNYLSMITGPRRDDESDGPEELHVVFLDHNRRALLGTAYEEMLACIRCGACLNVCPVYRKVSGHAYDSVYSGPMGKILTPLLSQGEEGRDLPGASTLCGACTEACPVEIPLADLLVRLRADLRVPGVLRPLRAPEAPRPAGPAHDRLPGEGFPWAAARAPLAFAHPAALGEAPRVRHVGADVGVAHRLPAQRRRSTGAGAVRTAVGAARPARRRLDRDARPPAPRAAVVPGPVGRAAPGGTRVVTTTVDGLRTALAANRVDVHGPFPAAEARRTVTERALAAAGTVAVSPADALVGALGVVDDLLAAGVDVLLPGADGWRERLPAAALGVTGSLLAVAETGSLALAAGAGAPRGVSLLPPVHLCLVAVADVVPTFAEAVARIARSPMPSALTWVGGPSRTGDLEMIQTLGVHGPVAVEVVLVD